MLCIKCGKNVNDGDRFCPSCGASLESMAAADANSEIEEKSAPSAGPSQQRSGSWIARLWRGEYPLVKSYWLFYCLPNFIVVMLLDAAEFFEVGGFITPIVFATVIATMIYTPIVCVGLWRSASSYKGPAVWRILAKLSVILAFYNYAQAIFMILEAAKLFF
jgi:hypothetical protein